MTFTNETPNPVYLPEPDEIPIERQHFVNQAIRCERKYSAKMEKVSDVRDTNNRTFGGKNKGLYSLSSLLSTKLRSINERCMAYGFESIIEEPEVVPPPRIKP
jgi:hypothetical protein